MNKTTEEYQPSLSFMKDLLTLASKCQDHDADTIHFNIGPVDDYVIKVSIEFSFEKVQEEEGAEHEQNN